MFFDDRLATVLRQEASSPGAQRTQFRQLLDILGNRKFAPPGRRDASLVAAAWLRMDALGRAIPAGERAAMIREPSWRFRSADLAAHLADFEPEVAAATLNRAQLSAEEWSALIPRLPVRARGFLRLRRDLPLDVERLLDRLGVRDRGLPPPAASLPEDPLPEPIQRGITDDPDHPARRAANDHSPLELDRELPAAAAPSADPGADPTEHDPIESGRSEISALVERIARFKRTREATDPDALTDSERSPRLPLDEIEPARSRRIERFAFSSDAAGRIDWAEAEIAPMVIGKRLVAPAAIGARAHATPLERAFLARQPIIAAAIELAGAPAIAGAWRIDAEPRFTREGHFTGYIGRFRQPLQNTDTAAGEAAQEADRIRQLLHELRTPVTAVQGYAEVIQQQLFGPAPHEYRALAAAIAADAAHILAGFEELDRLARLELGTAAVEPGEADLAALASQTSAQLAQVLSPRMAGITLDRGASAHAPVSEPAPQSVPHPVSVPLDPEAAELIVWRFLGTLGGACDASEVLAAQIGTDTGRARLVCDLPRQLSAQADIFNAEPAPGAGAINTGVFGAGFALRLARAEARASGGDLVREGERMALVLPLVEDTSQPGQAGPLDRGTQAP